MLKHGAQQLPGSDGNSFGRGAFLLEVCLGHAAENFHGFGVHAFHECEDVVQAVGEFASAAFVTAWASDGAFGEDVALCGGDVSREIAQSEFSAAAGPLDFVRRDAADEADRAPANLFEIVKKIVALQGAASSMLVKEIIYAARTSVNRLESAIGAIQRFVELCLAFHSSAVISQISLKSLPETYSRSSVAITRIPFFADIRREGSLMMAFGARSTLNFRTLNQ